MTNQSTASTSVLVRYRLVGGPVGVDQRLTVHTDGVVILEEHHRSRGSTELRIDAAELDRIRVAIEEVPDHSWSRASTLALARAKSLLVELFGPDLGRSFFQISRDRRSISGQAGDETEADGARALLDDLRLRAVRQAEALGRTGAR